MHLENYWKLVTETHIKCGWIEVKNVIIKPLHYVKYIQIWSTLLDLEAVFVERFKRTYLVFIKELMFNEGKANWMNHLEAVSSCVSIENTQQLNDITGFRE